MNKENIHTSVSALLEDISEQNRFFIKNQQIIILYIYLFIACRDRLVRTPTVIVSKN